MIFPPETLALIHASKLTATALRRAVGLPEDGMALVNYARRPEQGFVSLSEFLDESCHLVTPELAYLINAHLAAAEPMLIATMTDARQSRELFTIRAEMARDRMTIEVLAEENR